MSNVKQQYQTADITT